MRDNWTAVFVHPVAYGRDFIVYRHHNGTCDRCGFAKRAVLYIDSSDEEYGGAHLCRSCLVHLVETTPIDPCFHIARKHPVHGNRYCQVCGSSHPVNEDESSPEQEVGA